MEALLLSPQLHLDYRETGSIFKSRPPNILSTHHEVCILSRCDWNRIVFCCMNFCENDEFVRFSNNSSWRLIAESCFFKDLLFGLKLLPSIEFNYPHWQFCDNGLNAITEALKHLIMLDVKVTGWFQWFMAHKGRWSANSMKDICKCLLKLSFCLLSRNHCNQILIVDLLFLVFGMGLSLLQMFFPHCFPFVTSLLRSSNDSISIL